MLVIVSLLFFFFQAEDGIRYLIVTGVQTCALPISRAPGNAWPWLSVACRLASVVVVLASSVSGDRHDLARGGVNQDRKSVVEGKSVDLGGRRIIKKKKKNKDVYRADD